MGTNDASQLNTKNGGDTDQSEMWNLPRGWQVDDVAWDGPRGAIPHLWLSPIPFLQVVDGIEVYSTKIHCSVTSRFAHNTVTTRAVNRGDNAKEVSFDVELPKTAFITNFTLWVPWRLLHLGLGGNYGPAGFPFPNSLSL